jgi:hypothetical protein
MPRRKVDDDFIDDDGYDEDWEEEEFVGPSSDSSSDSDSEVDQFNSSNSDDSEAEPNPTSLRDDVDLDLEELQTELADLEVPFAGFTRPEHRNQRRKLHGQRIRHQTSIDLRSESPATIVEDLDFEASTPIVDNFPTPTDSERYPRRPVEIIELSSDDEAGSSSEDEDQSATQSAVQDDVGNSEEKFFSAPEGLEAVVGAKQKRRVTRRIIPDSDESDTDEPQGIEDFSTAGDLGIGGYFEGDQEEQTPQEIDYESPLATSLLLEEDGLSSDPSSTNGPRTLHLSPHPATFFAHEQFIDITKHTFENEELAVGTTVERRGTAMNGERSVFQIFRILRHEEDQNIYVEGRRFVFKSTFPYAEGTLLCQPNEVLAVAMSYRTSNTHSQEMERFPIEEVARIRKLEVITPSSDRHAVEQVNILPDVLFCQSILFLQYQNHKDRRRQRPRTKGALRNIKAEETDKATVSGQKRPIYRSKAQRGKQGAKTYTLIDFCCGCGGASEAAKLAGLRITDAVERDPFRAELYSKNFPGTSVHTEDLLNLSVKLMICTLDGDVLHLSVPCRFWSKAHTVPGKDDEVNKALLFEIPNWIEQVRPRQVTIEQVPGLIDDHYPYFLKLIFGIHALGYSVAWDVVDHKELGSGSERQRLVLIASA